MKNLLNSLLKARGGSKHLNSQGARPQVQGGGLKQGRLWWFLIADVGEIANCCTHKGGLKAGLEHQVSYLCRSVPEELLLLLQVPKLSVCNLALPFLLLLTFPAPAAAPLEEAERLKG